MKRNALPKLLSRTFAITAAVVTAALFFAGGPTSALPTQSTSPSPGASVIPTPLPSGANVLPLSSSLLFVLDDPISSKTARTDDAIRAHLKDALIVGGHTVAAAGAPVTIKVADVHGAKAPDIDGSIDVYFEPFVLANQQQLPLHTPTSHINPHTSAGAASTGAIADQIKDIFIPGHMIYRLFRKGSNVELGAGTVFRARTAAVIDASKPGVVSVVTPPPFSLSADPPHSDYKPNPFVTAHPKRTPAPKPSPTPAPTDTPPQPSASP